MSVFLIILHFLDILNDKGCPAEKIRNMKDRCNSIATLWK